MKKLSTSTMKSLLKRGLRKAKKMKRPSDGFFKSLFTEEKPNGWYYQVEYIYDQRFNSLPRVTVYAFRPPRSFNARSADYFLSKEISK